MLPFAMLPPLLEHAAAGDYAAAPLKATMPPFLATPRRRCLRYAAAPEALRDTLSLRYAEAMR